MKTIIVTGEQILRAIEHGKEITAPNINGRETLSAKTKLDIARLFLQLEKEQKALQVIRQQCIENHNLDGLIKSRDELISARLDGDPAQQKQTEEKIKDIAKQIAIAEQKVNTDIDAVLKVELDINAPTIPEHAFEQLDVSIKCVMALEPFIEPTANNAS